MDICKVNHGVRGRRRAARVGRGAASGMGKTAGRGQKGLGSRSGANYLRGYVGGQMQLKARLPKRGFSNAAFAVAYVPVNLEWLDRHFAPGAKVTPEDIGRLGVSVRRGDRVKILARGRLGKPLTVRAHAFSGAAAQKIAEAGGQAVVI